MDGFIDENRLQSWLTEQKEGWHRVEPSFGSTSGVFDRLKFADGRTWWMELKVGDMMASGFVHFRVRPAQIRIGREMLEQGIPAVFLVGERRRKRVWIGPVSELSLSGTTDDSFVQVPVQSSESERIDKSLSQLCLF